MKYNKLVKSLILTIIILLSYFGSVYYNTNDEKKLKTNVRPKLYEEVSPIDLETGLINNEYWNISSNGLNATETREGINRAIEYAYNNGIENIKLEKGTYLVDIFSFRGYKKSIVVKSGINLDLNGSKIIIMPNGETNYGIISIFYEDNISVFNGVIIGDRYEHDYNTISSTHEWGRGVDIRASENIYIYNLEIYNTTGDGIFIDEYQNKISKNINVNNCNIYNNRRQGISVITADGVNIYNNEIHDINGAWPQSGIDLERDRNTQQIKNVYIYGNKFYNNKSRRAIYVYSKIENLYIYDNEIFENIEINGSNNSGNETIHIGDNTFLVKKNVVYTGLNQDITDTFIDENLKNAILKLVGKTNNDRLYEWDIAKIAGDNVPRW